jgi:hypothetical protein
VQSWNAMLNLLEAGEVDPTSPYGDTMRWLIIEAKEAWSDQD